MNKGDIITGLENTETETTKVFHAGTAVKDGTSSPMAVASYAQWRWQLGNRSTGTRL